MPSDFNDAGLDVGAVAEAAAADEGEPQVAHDLLKAEVSEIGLRSMFLSVFHGNRLYGKISRSVCPYSLMAPRH